MQLSFLSRKNVITFFVNCSTYCYRNTKNDIQKNLVCSIYLKGFGMFKDSTFKLYSVSPNLLR